MASQTRPLKPWQTQNGPTETGFSNISETQQQNVSTDDVSSQLQTYDQGREVFKTIYPHSNNSPYMPSSSSANYNYGQSSYYNTSSTYPFSMNTYNMGHNSYANNSYMSSYQGGFQGGYQGGYNSRYNRPYYSSYYGGGYDGGGYSSFGGGYSYYDRRPEMLGYGESGWMGRTTETLDRVSHMLDMNTWFIDRICETGFMLTQRLHNVITSATGLTGMFQHVIRERIANALRRLYRFFQTLYRFGHAQVSAIWPAPIRTQSRRFRNKEDRKQAAHDTNRKKIKVFFGLFALYILYGIWRRKTYSK